MSASDQFLLEWRADQVRGMRQRIQKALATANNALFFNDSSNYRTALWDICLACGMDEISIGAEYIEHKAAEQP